MVAFEISESDRPMGDVKLPPWARIRLEEIDGELTELRAFDEPPTSLIAALEEERKTILDSRSPAFADEVPEDFRA